MCDSFFLVLVVWISGVVIEMVVFTDLNKTPPFPYMMIPPYAFIHGMSSSLRSCGDYACVGASNIRKFVPAIVYLWYAWVRE